MSLSHHRRHSSGHGQLLHGARLAHHVGKHAYHTMRRMSSSSGHTRNHSGNSHKSHNSGTHIEGLKGDDVHSGITDASYTVVIADSKKNVDYKAGKNSYVEITGGRMVASCGSQNVQTVTTLGTTSEWFVNSTPFVNHFGTANISIGLFNTNYNQFITGGSFYADQGKKVATDKFHLSAVNVKLSMVNFNSVPVSSWIYILECKVATNFSPNDLWTRDLSLANVVGSFAPAGNTLPGFNSGGNAGIDAPGVVNETPGACPNFTKIWKIKKVHRVNLAAAAQEDIDFHIKMHQTGDVSRFVSQNPAMTVDPATWVAGNIAVQYPRGSVSIMHVGRSGVVRDVTTPEGGSPADAITYGPVDVGIVCTKTYHMYPMKAGSSRFDAKVVLPQIPFNTSQANTRVLNVVDISEAVKSA